MLRKAREPPQGWIVVEAAVSSAGVAASTRCKAMPWLFKVGIDKEASTGHLPQMRTVGLKILKNQLSEYVRLAAAGETVVITDRGRAVAEIVPHRRQQNESFFERGVREGWLTPATDRSGHPPPRKPIKGYSFEQLMAELERDREDRF